ncbi:magnesium-dependent phosphatase-1 [Bacteroidota bacterium]
MLIVFDLDFTLWNYGGTYFDHTIPPYSKINGYVFDREMNEISLYPEVPEILEDILIKDIKLGIASKTNARERAVELLEMFNIYNYFSYIEMYPGNKTIHFHNLNQSSGIPFQKMLFFDDDHDNLLDVSTLGIDSVYVQEGINKLLVSKSLQEISF